MPAPPRTDVGRWTAGRIIAVVIGSLMLLAGLGFLVTGGAALWATQTQRDGSGYLVTPSSPLSTGTYALTSQSIQITGVNGETWTFPQAVLGTTKIEVSSSTGRELFVGLAPTQQASRYLAGVGRGIVTDVPDGGVQTIQGRAPQGPPGEQTFWTAQRSGTGNLTLTWTPSAGSWTVVVMNADASRGVDITARVGAKIPTLTWIAVGLLALGATSLIVGILLVVIPLIRVSRQSKRSRAA